MKKNYFILVILLIMVVGYAATQMKIDIKGNTTLSENTSDFNVYLANLKLNGTEIEGINETKDGYEINVPSKGTLEYDVINDSTEYDVEATVECEEETGTNEVTNFDYTGSEQTFVAPVTGVYKLETWGAQGGSGNQVEKYVGGYGGYSIGFLNLNSNDKLYINVASQGKSGCVKTICSGGYNGGAKSGAFTNDAENWNGGGGGATHVSTKSGLLSNLRNFQNNILIVSGDRGGAMNRLSDGIKGGSGGGYIGNNSISVSKLYTGTGGTQTNGGKTYLNNTIYSNTIDGSFGSGGTFLNTSNNYNSSGGGSGYYGGAFGGGGGSGYIGNPLLTEKSMYCYNCQESTEESTKTISTTCVNETPTENCAKIGNGYARITQMSPAVSSTQLEATTIEAQDKLNKSVEVSNNGMTCSLKIKKLSRTEKKVYTGPTEWTFDYTGGEQTFTAPLTGTYKLETWGAQGGSTGTCTGGYGGYSQGTIILETGKNIYINVGGEGIGGLTWVEKKGGYNGGGYSTINSDTNSYNASGGGATHIATVSGLLSTLSNKIYSILIVSGSGGGIGHNKAYGCLYRNGSGGGFRGTDSTLYKDEGAGKNFQGGGGSQTSTGNIIFAGNSLDINVSESNLYGFGAFGRGGSSFGGSGAGYYGGSSSGYYSGGGSGYIGNSLLTNKSMYCYNCTESTEESTKTISTTCTSATPTENCAKSGNGYARITLIK